MSAPAASTRQLLAARDPISPAARVLIYCPACGARAAWNDAAAAGWVSRGYAFRGYLCGACAAKGGNSYTKYKGPSGLRLELRNGLTVETDGGYMGFVRVLTVPESYKGNARAGNRMALYCGHSDNPAEWRGGAHGDQYDVIRVLA